MMQRANQNRAVEVPALADLTYRRSQSFSAEYEKLRADFCKTADSLREAMSAIASATEEISSGFDQMATAFDGVSRPTVQQAAALEATSAALSTITETVKSIAAVTSEAVKVVSIEWVEAQASRAVGFQAVDEMRTIKQSSSEIGSFIGVIDEIVYHTNLFALNAGADAARPGDAGRGFAVIASEERAPAPRSVKAAKKNNALVTLSTEQVESGLMLVGQAGSALREIVGKITNGDGLVRTSSAPQEQATSPAEINTAIGQKDQAVQQSAAMVKGRQWRCLL